MKLNYNRIDMKVYGLDNEPDGKEFNLYLNGANKNFEIIGQVFGHWKACDIIDGLFDGPRVNGWEYRETEYDFGEAVKWIDFKYSIEVGKQNDFVPEKIDLREKFGDGIDVTASTPYGYALAGQLYGDDTCLEEREITTVYYNWLVVEDAIYRVYFRKGLPIVDGYLDVDDVTCIEDTQLWKEIQ